MLNLCKLTPFHFYLHCVHRGDFALSCSPFLVFCVVFSFCYQCFWLVHSGLPLRFFNIKFTDIQFSVLFYFILQLKSCFVLVFFIYINMWTCKTKTKTFEPWHCVKFIFNIYEIDYTSILLINTKANNMKK